jgi:two-component system, chemotaxis family, chemotaxis protein CheY
VKTLIVEDEFTSRALLREILKRFGVPQVALNGRQAVDLFGSALESGEPFDLVCLDIMMPEMDGQEALRQMRTLEARAGIDAAKRAKVVMTTALADRNTVVEAINAQCDYFLVKPIDGRVLLEQLRNFGLVS